MARSMVCRAHFRGTFARWPGLFKKKLIAGAMPPGMKLPPNFAAAVIPEPTSIEEGLAELRAAIARLEQEPHRARKPLFGNLTKEEWNRIHLNHAKLHMSFLVPQMRNGRDNLIHQSTRYR